MSYQHKFGLMIVMGIGMIMTLTACNLNAPDDASDEDSNTDTAIATATPTISEPSGNRPDIFDDNNSTGNITDTDNEACQPRLDWSVYTVQPGDTLTSIAERSGTTIEDLVAGNCLDDANLIDRGQELRVPRLPSANVGTGGTGAVQSSCAIVADFGGYDPTNAPIVASAQPISAGCYAVQAGTTITVSWDGAPANWISATFYRNNSTLSRADVIGTDTNPADGLAVTFTVNAQMPASAFYVSANSAAQGSEVFSSAIVVYVAQ